MTVSSALEEAFRAFVVPVSSSHSLLFDELEFDIDTILRATAVCLFFVISVQVGTYDAHAVMEVMVAHEADGVVRGIPDACSV